MHRLDEAKAKRRLVRRLDRVPFLTPVRDETSHLRHFARFDLAMWVAIRCGKAIDPDSLKGAVRKKWVGKALHGNDERYMGQAFLMGRRTYWILGPGRKRIGTIGVQVKPFSWPAAIEISHLSVIPKYRRQGIAHKALAAVVDAAFKDSEIERVGLSADWCNRAALKFYLAQGMWVRSWKHDVNFYVDRDDPARLGAWRVVVSGELACFVHHDKVLVTAFNKGDRLDWRVLAQMDDDLRRAVDGTFAVWLGVHGWPLIRSDQLWGRQINLGFSDCGHCEGLAWRSRGFERYNKEHGWLVPQRNVSLTTLPTFVSAEEAGDIVAIKLSDGQKYQYPKALINGTLKGIKLSADRCEVLFRVAGGADDFLDVPQLQCELRSKERIEQGISWVQQQRETTQRAATGESE